MFETGSMLTPSAPFEILGISQKELKVVARLYTEEDKEFIRINYAKLGALGCAEVLGRSRASVQTKAQQLGVRQYASKPWAEKEKQFLRDHYPTNGGYYCAEKLGRSFHATHKMVEKLELAMEYKGWYTDVQGYVVITPNRETKLYEHRLVMEEQLGRPLLSSEIVHHIDGKKSNNDPSNLMLMTRSTHIKEHHEEILTARHGKPVNMKR